MFPLELCSLELGLLYWTHLHPMQSFCNFHLRTQSTCPQVFTKHSKVASGSLCSNWFHRRTQLSTKDYGTSILGIQGRKKACCRGDLSGWRQICSWKMRIQTIRGKKEKLVVRVKSFRERPIEEWTQERDVWGQILFWIKQCLHQGEDKLCLFSGNNIEAASKKVKEGLDQEKPPAMFGDIALVGQEVSLFTPLCNTVIPLHKNEFHSESTFVSSICSEVQQG